jgi:autotransporter-associated beta strand protein
MKSKVNTIRMIGCLTAPLAAVMAATLTTAPAVQATTTPTTYTSVSTGGNWQTSSTWGATSTSYPGENEAGDTADISSGSPVTLGGTISNDLGDVNIAAGGTLELNNGASIPGQASNDDFNVGSSGTGTGTLDVASGSTSTVYNLNVGSGSQGGYVNQTGGTLTVANGAALYGNDGTYLISGGTLDLPGYYFGASGASGETFTLDVAGGTVNLNHYTYVAESGTGTITITSGGTLDNTAGFQVAHSSGTGTINLDGGTFETSQTITGSASTGSSYINFNGGTLQATANISSLLSTFTAANVQAGGAIINTNGFDDTIGQALLHDATLGTTPDGGLTKTGAGTLTLSGTGNTYNGNTTVDNGTLQIDAGFLAATSTVSIASGALMNLDYAGTDTIASLILGGSSMGPGTYSHTNDPTYFGNFTGVLNVTGSNIPEPTTLALCGLGGVGLLLLGQRRRHA